MKAVLICTALAHAVAGIPTVEIAPGVFMPMVNHGAGNQTLWLEVGGRGMDTALSYGDNNQISVATAAHSKLAVRSDLFITTKIPCCPSTFYEYGVKKCANNTINLGSTAAEIDRTLSRVGENQVDLLLMHWPCDSLDDTVSVWKVMESYVAAGKVRAIGVSNFNASALESLTKRASIKPAVTQNPYSVGNHFNKVYGSDDETLKYCKANNVTLSSWGSLGGTTGIDVLKNEVVKAVATSHKKSTAQVALRYLVQLGVVAVTSGENPEHLKEDLEIFDFELTTDEMARLEAIGKGSSSIVV